MYNTTTTNNNNNIIVISINHINNNKRIVVSTGGATILVGANGTAMRQRGWAVLSCTPNYCIETQKHVLYWSCIVRRSCICTAMR